MTLPSSNNVLYTDRIFSPKRQYLLWITISLLFSGYVVLSLSEMADVKHLTPSSYQVKKEWNIPLRPYTPS